MMPSSDWEQPALLDSTRSSILVVEDEFLIRMLIADELRDAGFNVIEAASADDAIAALDSLVPIDLVFSDVKMPGSLDGIGLLAVVRSTFPTLPVIITSAHLEAASAIADGAARFVPKPYSLLAVVALIRQELGQAI
jgi:DNA-binding NtrC family response regulator